MRAVAERFARMDAVARRLLLTYLASIAVWLVAVEAYARVGRLVILGLGLLMWTTGAVTAWIIQEQGGHIAARTRYVVASYGLLLLLYRVVAQVLGGISPEDWGAALGAGLPVPLTMAASGWLYTLVLILMVGVPVGHTAWIAQLYMVHRGRQRVEEAISRYQRRAP